MLKNDDPKPTWIERLAAWTIDIVIIGLLVLVAIWLSKRSQ